MLSQTNLPVALLLDGRAALVVGHGPELERRVNQFLEAGACVRVVTRGQLEAGRLTSLAQLGNGKSLEICEREYDEADLDDRWIAVLTDRDASLAAAIALAAEQRCLFFCAVDQPEFGSFAHVALTRQGPISIAVSSGGAVPGLSARLRDEISRLLASSAVGSFAHRVAALRRRLEPDERASVVSALMRAVRLDGRVHLPSEALSDAERRWPEGGAS